MRGALRTGAVLVAFLAFGLGWAGVLSPAASNAAPGPYLRSMPSDSSPTPSSAPAVEPTAPQLWLIDGYNVVCANLLGGRDRSRWWSAENRTRLLDQLARFDDRAAELWVVFDGDTPEPPPSEIASDRAAITELGPRIETVFAPDADAWLMERVKAHTGVAQIAVVTSDRKVADRARHRGAQIFAPKALLGRCTG